MASYSACFISDFATISVPLRELTHKGVKWEWNDVHEDAFHKLKLSMSETTVMTHLSTEKGRNDLRCISCWGWAMLVQGGKTVAYASRILSSVDQRYSQIEREGFVIIFGCLRFEMYLLGRQFTVVTDLKPLLPLLSARVDGIHLRSQGFDLQ